jgi:hypothetical protein
MLKDRPEQDDHDQEDHGDDGCGHVSASPGDDCQRPSMRR